MPLRLLQKINFVLSCLAAVAWMALFVVFNNPLSFIPMFWHLGVALLSLRILTISYHAAQE